MHIPTLNHQAYCAVVQRHILMWLKKWQSSVTVSIVNPLLFLFAFGVGMGAVINTMEDMPYLTFIVAGILAQGVMFVASFEMSVECHARIVLQRFHDSVLATSVTLQDLILGEILWATLKAALSGLAIFVVGLVWGGIELSWPIIFVIPLIFLGGFVFGATGIALTAFAKGFEFFAYFFTFWTTPMFMLSGVFFPTSRLPHWVEVIVSILPMKPFLDMVRSLTSGHYLSLFDYVLHTGHLVLLSVVAYLIAYKKFQSRFFD